jgi:hypothetical protein
MQHKQLGALQLQVSGPQASLLRASYCSLAFHLPEGTVRSHTVSTQAQTMQQQGHLQKSHLHPKHNVGPVHAPQEAVVVNPTLLVVNPTVAVHVGPITLAFPGYALLLRFAGRNGAMSYTSSVGIVIHS